MAVCDFCFQEMLEADGCTYNAVEANGALFERELVGDEGWVYEGERCGDCGALYGHYHHPQCDIERCPNCGRQLISCSCNAFYLKSTDYPPLESKHG